MGEIVVLRRRSQVRLRHGSRSLQARPTNQWPGVTDAQRRNVTRRIAAQRSGGGQRIAGAGGENRTSMAEGLGGQVRDIRTARLEAVLLVLREPTNTRKLASLAGLADGTEARTLIRRLNRWYDESASAFRAEEVAGGFQLLSRSKFGPWLRRLVRSPVEVRLSAPALETLAVVAYRQPVLRAEIEAVRGVDCGDLLRQLLERDLVRVAGRSDELGRPYWYGTTKRFLQVFGLRHLDDLPRAESLRRRPQPAAPTTTN